MQFLLIELPNRPRRMQFLNTIVPAADFSGKKSGFMAHRTNPRTFRIVDIPIARNPTLIFPFLPWRIPREKCRAVSNFHCLDCCRPVFRDAQLQSPYSKPSHANSFERCELG